MLYSDSRIDDAIRHAQEAIEVHARLTRLAAAPGREERGKRNERLHEMALAESNLGALHARASSLDRAVDCYEHAVAALSELAEEAPHEQRYRSDLAMSLNNLGLLRCRLEQHASATASFERALTFQQQLVEETPDNPDFLSRLGGVYNNLGTIQLKLSEFERAAAAFSSAVRYQQRAVELAPDVDRFREFLAKHQANLQQIETGVKTAAGTSHRTLPAMVAAPVLNPEAEYHHESP